MVGVRAGLEHVTLPISGGQARPADLATAKRALSDRAAELERVRSAATKWQAGLAGLLAIATGLLIPALGTTIRELETQFGVALALGAIAATGVGVAAAIAALHASGGVPKVSSTLTVGGDHDDAVAATRNLRRAISLSIVALGLAGAVCLLSWFSPRKTDAPSYEQVQAGSHTVCGQVDAKSVPGQLLVTTKSKTIEIVALTAVTSWVKVDSCP